MTRGFLWFRDFVLLGFVTAIVLAGVATVRSLHNDDCRAMNARRRDVAAIFQELLDNDKNMALLLPPAFKDPLLERYQRQLDDINDAYRFTDCPGSDLPEP